MNRKTFPRSAVSMKRLLNISFFVSKFHTPTHPLKSLKKPAHVLFMPGDPGEDLTTTDDAITLPLNDGIIVLADGTAIDARHNKIQTEEQKRENMRKRDEVSVN